MLNMYYWSQSSKEAFIGLTIYTVIVRKSQPGTLTYITQMRRTNGLIYITTSCIGHQNPFIFIDGQNPITLIC